MKPFELLNRKELAALLGRSPDYVSAMRRAGFTQAVPGRYRYEQAVRWLEDHPEFRMRTAYPSKTPPRQHMATFGNTSEVVQPAGTGKVEA